MSTSYHLRPEHLFTVSEPVSPRRIHELRVEYPHIVKAMIKLKGAGLAANQLGYPERWFVWAYGMVINPVIEAKSPDTGVAIEGCLSSPNKMKEVTRPNSIIVNYTDERGIHCTKTLTGTPARIFQHEFDHLNGTCLFST